MERLLHPRIKTSPSHQDAWPPDATHRAGRPHTKKDAAKKSLGRKKTLLHSQHHCVKAACRLRWRRVDTRTRLRLRDGLR